MRVLSLIIFTLLIFQTMVSADTSAPVDHYNVTTEGTNPMRIVNSGMGALYARLDMIRRARSSIDLETYIFNTDTSGKLILKELAEAGKRGVKIRVLVDKFNMELNEHIVKELKKSGIEIRYYNPASLINVGGMQLRNHRKIFAIDGEEAITGGRNIADEYFDLSKRFNYLDRDSTVEGPVVKSMVKTFVDYWDSKMTEIPKEVSRPEPYSNGEGDDGTLQQRLDEFERKENFAKNILNQNAEVERVIKIAESTGKGSFLKHEKHNCPKLTFASDKPGARFSETLNPEKYTEKYRVLGSEIEKWLDKHCNDEITIDTPYFLESPLSYRFRKYLSDKKCKIKLFTNSLASTDATHVATAFASTVTEYTHQDGFQAFVYRGNYSGEDQIHDDIIRKARWGTHSKSMVINEKSFMLGTYNVDNRSSYYNNELALFCNGSPELTKDVMDNIVARMNKSNRLNAQGDPDECEDPSAPSVGALKKFIYYMIKIPSLMGQPLL